MYDRDGISTIVLICEISYRYDGLLQNERFVQDVVKPEGLKLCFAEIKHDAAAYFLFE